MVNHNRTARWQLHRAGVGRFNLVLNLEAAEQRRVVAVTLDAVRMLGHHVVHELLGLLVHVVGVKQDVADVAVEIITNRADNEARFLVNQEGTFTAFASAFNGCPELDQVVQVPLQFRRTAANAGGAGNDAGTRRVLQLVHVFFQLGPVFAFNASADTTTAGIVGHQHHVAAGQRHKGRQSCALVAALFFFDLNHQFLAFANHVLNARLANRYARGKVIARDLLEWQKAVAVFTVVNKTRFKRRLNTRDDCLINVSLALLAPFNFNFIVEQFLPVNNRQTALFCLSGIDQHAFHVRTPFSSSQQLKSEPTMP